MAFTMSLFIYVTKPGEVFTRQTSDSISISHKEAIGEGGGVGGGLAITSLFSQ